MLVYVYNMMRHKGVTAIQINRHPEMAMHRPSTQPTKPAHNQKRSPEKLAQVIVEIADCGNISETARRCGITPWLMYYWQRRSQDGFPGYTVDMGGVDDDGQPLVAEFHEAWDAALEMSSDYLEKEMQRRGVDGYEEPVVHKGIQAFVRDPDTGELERDADGKPIPLTIRRYSDRMLEVLIKARRPEKFRENINVQAHVTGGVLAIPHSDQANLSADDWAARFKDNADGKTIEGTPVYPDEVDRAATGREPETGQPSVRALMEQKIMRAAEEQDPELEARVAETTKRAMEKAHSLHPEGAQSGPRGAEYDMKPGIKPHEMTPAELAETDIDPLA